MEVNSLSPMSSLTALTAATRPNSVTELTQAVAAVRAVNKSGLFGQDRELLFARDGDTQASVIQVVSRETGEVLEQIPPENIVKILADLKRQGKGADK